MAAALPQQPLVRLPDRAPLLPWAWPAAIGLHLALLALLSLNWTAAPEPLDNPPMEVDLIAEVAPRSTAPVIAATPPPPKLGEVEEEEPAPPPPPAKAAPPPPPPPKVTAPAPKASPVKAPPVKAPPPKAPPTKAPSAKAPPAKALPTKAPPTKAPPPRPTGRLDGIAGGLSKAPPTKAPPVPAAPAAQTAAEVRKSIDVAIDGKILPHWRRNVPSGIDIDQLRVVLRIKLNSDGSVAGVDQLGDLSGRTDSNRPQQALFVERAIRSIRQAAPFDLPAEYYDQWRVWDVTFRARGI
jgi:outer membrane biosynthesis protein TonB